MAKVVVHEIVSNFDTIVVLKNLSIHFAPWDDSDVVAAGEVAECAAERVEWGLPIAPSSKKMTTKKDEKVAIIEENITESMEPNSLEHSIFGDGPPNIVPEVVTTDKLDSGESGDTKIQSKVQTDTQITADLEPSAEVQCMEEGPVEEDSIHFHVCSGNLMSASPWFNRVLQKNGWIESIRNGEDKHLYVYAEDWDEDAFLILMNIFHVRNRKVPRTISLEMLAKIALLVDYYDCAEAIEQFTEIWVADLRTTGPIPTTYCRDLILWIWVSWIFKLPDRYQESTEIAIKQCTESIRNLGLPIPSWITDAIDLNRYQAIENVVASLHDLLDEYRSATYICPQGNHASFPCGSMLLGSLTKEMDVASLLFPRPVVPFPDLSFSGVCDTVRCMKSGPWNIYHYNSYGGQHGCTLTKTLAAIIGPIDIDTIGLRMREHACKGAAKKDP